MNIYEKVKTIIIEQLGRKPENIAPETSFKDLDVDSLDVVQLIMAIEDEFDIIIEDEEAERLDTMPHAIAFIEEKLEAK
ncbi:MAG: acyl carrier protein [Clostridia bacterium]|jgi:acyl carrier protein|nr:acyl carrier protein [Clostridia bacterium]MDD4570906.1 acyl carrier protein [Clostridia bacterium]